MAYFNGSTNLTGTSSDDLMAGDTGVNSTINGGGGDDIIYGDFQPHPFVGGATFDIAVNLMAIPGFWNLGENSDVGNATSVPHGSALIVGDDIGQWFSITVAAGQRLTVDIDYGESEQGVSFDSRVELYESDGTTLIRANSDTGFVNPADYGSTSGQDSRLEQTFTTGGTYLIRVIQQDGAEVPTNANVVANFSLTGQAVSGTVIAGDDSLIGGDGNDVIHGMGGNDNISGSAGDDLIYGGSGNDIINGFTGQDSVFGGAGNDTFRISTPSSLDGDDIDGGSGSDTLDLSSMTGLVGWDVNFSTIRGLIQSLGNTDGADGQYRAQSVERVLGTNNADVMTGGSNQVSFYGGAGADTLTGGTQNDVLDGGIGADAMAGGRGNDKFYVDNVGDTVTEVANGGNDTVFAAIDFALSAGNQVETIRSDGNSLELFGNELRQRIHGDSGSNDLHDGGGAGDVLIGKAGDDEYYLDSADTKIREGKNNGTDVVYVDDFDYNLRDNWHVEFLAAMDPLTTGDFDLTGNKRDNTIVGNDGDNVIIGGKGNDEMFGNGGADTFQINEYANGKNRDVIVDFESGVDMIELKSSVFTKIGAGVVDANEFRVNDTGLAENRTDRLIYNETTGELFYDQNGSRNGDSNSVLVATLTNLELITIDDLLIV
jgi:Ca2+-binding RTX toxin-like protein